MTLPSSGPLTLADIQGEFGGSNPISLSEYYAGGAYVPAGTTGVNGPVPTSGAISISDFYGTSNVVISVSNRTVFDFTGGRRAATTGYRLTSGGQADRLVGTTWTNIEQWCTPTSAASDYEVLATVVTGSLSSGTDGSWLPLSSTRAWTRTAAIGNNEICEFTVQIRKVGTTTVLDSATITLEADAQF